MNFAKILSNVIYTAQKLHFQRDDFGYDMKYYPAFSFYYYRYFLKYNLNFTSIFCYYKLNQHIYRKSTTEDLETNDQLALAGNLLKYSEIDERKSRQIEEIHKGSHFYTSQDIMNDFTNLSLGGTTYKINIDFHHTFFYNLFNKWVGALFDNVPIFLNLKTLQIVDLENAFFENKNNLYQIDCNLSPEKMVYLAKLISLEIDSRQLNGVLDQFTNSGDVSEELIEALNMTLSAKSKLYYENILGLEMFLTSLTDTNI